MVRVRATISAGPIWLYRADLCFEAFPGKTGRDQSNLKHDLKPRRPSKGCSRAQVCRQAFPALARSPLKARRVLNRICREE